MSAGKIIFICFTALLLNLVGSLIVMTFNLPIFLDASGTIFIAALGGYVPGIAVGFFTNLIKAFFVPSEMYYCLVSILIAIFTTYFVRNSLHKNFGKILLLILVLTFFTSTCDWFIEKFLNASRILQPIDEFELDFSGKLLSEFIDKTFSILLAFTLLKWTPLPIKKLFHTLGQKQAPLSLEMRKEIYRRKCPHSSLRTKVLLMLMLSSLFIAASIASITYRIFEQAAFNTHVKVAETLTSIIASEIDPAQVDNYIKFGRNAAGYNDVEKKLYAIKDSNSDIKNLRVEKISATGSQIIFNTEENFSPDNKKFLSDEVIISRRAMRLLRRD